MKAICAWCQNLLENKGDWSGTSHGICQACTAAWLDELEKRKITLEVEIEIDKEQKNANNYNPFIT